MTRSKLDPSSPLARVLAIYGELDALSAASSLMGWDRQVLMPPGGAEARSVHQALLTCLRHQILTGDDLRRALENAKDDVDPAGPSGAMVRNLKREAEIDSKLPVDLVERKSRVGNKAYEIWKLAKAQNNFKMLQPYLEQLFEIARETAECLGYTEHIYDPLIDLYEEGATFEGAQAMFKTIREPISSLVAEIGSCSDKVRDDFLTRDWDKRKLREFAEKAAKHIGFDFERGRLNIAPNAFCSTISTGDVRMTTRASEHLKGIISSSLHEMGHGLYEQGSPPEWDRTPLAGGVSLGVHESQSRLWENIIGRSEGFWMYFLPALKQSFPEITDVSGREFYRAYNKVQAEFIRVGADELTYNLHILIRFELEVEVLTAQIRVADLPEAWNDKYERYMGIRPTTDTVGCLQDVHWSRGAIGYFPTYAMGNLIGAQVWACLQRDLGDTHELLARGEFEPILAWLTENIYSKASLCRPSELIRQVTGKGMGAGDWLEYADQKFRAVYNLR